MLVRRVLHDTKTIDPEVSLTEQSTESDRILYGDGQARLVPDQGSFNAKFIIVMFEQDERIYSTPSIAPKCQLIFIRYRPNASSP